jgi:hypothetical protein
MEARDQLNVPVVFFFFILQCCQYLDYILWGGRIVNEELKIICKEAVEESLPRGYEENDENLPSGKSLRYPFYRRLGGRHSLPRI